MLEAERDWLVARIEQKKDLTLHELLAQLRDERGVVVCCDTLWRFLRRCGEADTASKRYAREYGMCAIRDIHTEDVNIINRAQKGLLSGAIRNVHFMSMEGLCRHLLMQVKEEVALWQAEQGEQA